MVNRGGSGGHRVVPNVTGPVSTSDNNMNSTITRLTNSFQVNGIGKKGVAPPVPPNKPSVPVKKTELSKRSDSVVEGPGSSHPVVAGLQGLKFGISLSSSESSKGIKPLSESNVPAKKFFNNIESKS